MTTPQELMKAVNAALKTNALTTGSDPQYRVTYAATGLLPFDKALNGGLPRGRMIEIFGDYSTLKSYVGLNAIAQAQKRGEVCALIDTEHTFDDDWAAACGVDTTKLLIWPRREDFNPDDPPTGEMAMDVMRTLLLGRVDLLVIDSVAAMLPQQQYEQRLSGEKVQPGRLAQLMSLGLRHLTMANRKTAILWINQTRQNIGVMFGNPEQATGGKALGFYTSIRIRVRRAGSVSETVDKFDGEKTVKSKKTVAHKFVIVLEKSKLHTPVGEEHFVWDLRTGTIDSVQYLVSLGMEQGAVTNKGTMWTFQNTTVRGREKFMTEIRKNPALLKALQKVVLPSSSLGNTVARKRTVAVRKRTS